MLAGEYERAIEVLEAGGATQADSVSLRAGLLQMRLQAVTQLAALSAAERAAGRLDSAERLLRRAQRFDDGAHRVDTLLAELAIERRQQSALTQAHALASRDPDSAYSLVQAALRENPKHRELLGLRRQIEQARRESDLVSLRTGLTESRPISLDFRDVNLRTLLDVVTRNSGVNFVLDQDVRRDIQVSVYLKSVRVEEAIDLVTSTHGLAKKVLDGRTILIYPNTQEKRREYQEQVVRLFYLTNAEAKGAAAFLVSMLRLREPYVDERSNFLALRDVPENIALAERLLSLYDTPEPEVVLELEVIEIRSSRLLDVGIKVPDSVTLTPLGPGGSAGGLTLENLGALRRGDIAVTLGSVLLNLRREAGDFNTLANPRIRARNKQKARVLVGDKVPVVTTTTGQGGFVSDSVNYLDVGLKLEIQPTVHADDEVSMAVALEVSSVSREVQTAGGGLAYQIGTRSAGTTLRLRDGETQVLAGLLSREERSSASRIPGLGDLPVAGRLFSSQRDDSSKTELVLAITPRVVRNITLPEISESEIWIGTEANTRLRPMGGRAPARVIDNDAIASAVPTQSEARAVAPVNGLDGSQSQQSAKDKPSVAVLAWAGPTRASVGSSISVTLNIESAAELQGAAAALSFDASKLQLLSVREGDFLRAPGVKTAFSQQVSEGQGSVQFKLSRDAPGGGNGRGSLVELTFVARASGVASFTVSSVKPVSLNSPEPLVVLPSSFSVQIAAP